MTRVFDYIQPANNDFPEKIQSTVTIGGINVAEALVAKGKHVKKSKHVTKKETRGFHVTKSNHVVST